MRVRACRGVCIGVDRHLKAGDLADLDAAQVQFLVSIGAVECVADDPVPAGGKPAVAQGTDGKPKEPESKPASAKTEKK